MRRIQSKLVQWKDMYLALGRAQAQLKAAEAEKQSAAEVERLRAEVGRLEADSEAALLEVQTQVAKIKSEKGVGTPTSPPRH
ncbi:MAG: hypothetical protein ACXWJM_16800 [Ramlibacter sp.]